MRPLRILESPFSSVTTVHLISRVIERRMVLDDVAKEKFRELLARQSALSQIEIVTFCLLSNHFHILARYDRDEPNPVADAPDDGFLDHLSILYSPEVVQRVGWQLESYRARGMEAEAAALRQQYLDRMRDIPSLS